MNKITQLSLLIVLLIICFFGFKNTALASDIELTINADGNIIDNYNSRVVGDLYRGWRENILFASLSQESTLRDNFTVSVQGDGVSLQSINPKLYAVHGAMANEITNDDEFRQWAVSASRGSQITLVAQVPYGTFHDSFFWKIMALLSTLSDNMWLVLSFIFPITIALALIAKQQLSKATKSKAPTIHAEILNVPPAVLTVLVRGFVSKRASAATLVDLAQRGHLQMLIRNNKILLYKRNGGDLLRAYEQAILERWFKSQWSSRGEDLKLEIKTQVINDRSKTANMMIYKEVENFGWFKIPPLVTHWKILILCFIATVVTSLFFFAIFILLPSANPLLWFLTSCLVCIGILYAWEPSITQIENKGKEARQMLNETRITLTDPTPIRMAPNNQAAWEHYLALSIVLGITPQWLNRWSSTPFQQPSWLLTTEPIRDFDDFLTHLTPILNIASESIRDTILPAYI